MDPGVGLRSGSNGHSPAVIREEAAPNEGADARGSGKTEKVGDLFRVVFLVFLRYLL